MSASLTVQIADEVTALLNGAASGTFTPTFTAARRFAPYFDLPDLAQMKVSVVPSSKDQTFTSRSQIDADHEIKIYVQKHLTSAEDPTEIDPLTGLLDSIADYLASDDDTGRSRRLLPTSQASLMRLSGAVVYTKELVEQMQFTSVLVATYSGTRAFR